MSLTYKFHRGEVRATSAYPFDTMFRPEIAVRIGAIDGPRKPYMGLLDTGADDTKLPMSEAKRLGVELNLNERVLFRGVGGETYGFYGTVTLELRQLPKAYLWKATVAFLQDSPTSLPEDRMPVSLGQTGFFRYFSHHFRLSTRSREDPTEWLVRWATSLIG